MSLTGAAHAQGELLLQVKPAVTTAVTLFQASQLRTEITLLVASLIESYSGGGVSIVLYHDDSGTTYDDTTVIWTATRATTDVDMLFQAQHAGSGIFIKPGGSLGVKIDSADDVNFSLYGITETLADITQSSLR